MHFECSRIHDHKNIHSVAGSKNILAGELYLKCADARKGSRRSPDFSRIIRESSEIIPHHCGGSGKAVSHKLHPIAGITGKANHHILYGLRFV